MSGRVIYRSPEGEHAIRDWCERRLAGAGLSGRDVETSLGTTRVTTVGEGPDVVLLPGTNLCTATWPDLLALVGLGHRALGVDLPGQPGLSAATRPRDRDAYGTWLRDVVGALSLEHPVVVGHSLGGRAALLAARDDETIGALVLVDPAGPIRLRVGAAMLVTTIRWLVRRDEASSRALLRRMTAPGAEPPPELAEWMALVARHVRTSLAPAPLSAQTLAAVRCPVQLVTGRHDVFLPAERLAGALARVGGPTETTVVETAGHLLPHEAPQELVDIVASAARP